MNMAGSCPLDSSGSGQETMTSCKTR